jgi:hypothetical protein
MMSASTAVVNYNRSCDSRGEMELVARAGKATQSHAFEPVMRLQMGKAHLDRFL